MSIGIRKTIKNALSVRKYCAIQQLPRELLSTQMGCDRGTAIDRYYIEHFLEENRCLIKGDVMEIAENTYTHMYGSDISNSYIFTKENDVDGAIHGDLVTGEGCIENLVDCFILTQTFPFMYDVKSAVKNIVRMIKPGGTALVTVRGICMVSRYDEERWGDYWGFTMQSLKKLFEEWGIENIQVTSYGNAKTATAFLFGMCQEDLEEEDFLYNDPLVPVILAAVVKKDM